jgi:hypothetical protein
VDEGTARLLLLEGHPRIDKTTVARRALTLLHEAGVPVGGFTTGELRTGGRRQGFVVEAASGARDVLAHLGLPGPPTVGRYGVDLSEPRTRLPGEVISRGRPQGLLAGRWPTASSRPYGCSTWSPTGTGAEGGPQPSQPAWVLGARSINPPGPRFAQLVDDTGKDLAMGVAVES